MDISEIIKDGTGEKEISVEEIMAKIREDILRRKQSAVFLERNTGIPEKDSLLGSLEENNIQRDLEIINSNWDIQNNSYFISSHRPVAGKFLIKGRELVNGEIRRYSDPIIWKQAEFNRSSVHLFNHTANKLSNSNNEIRQLRSEIDSKIEKIMPEFEEKIEQLKPEFENKVEQLKPEFENKVEKLRSEINSIIKSEVNSIVSSMKFDIENKVWLASIIENRAKEGYKKQEAGTSDPESLDINYFRFEEQFRGSREDIKQRQSNFINYFAGCSNILDIGCGRGEFLELSKELGICAKGIDIDDTMVDYCISKGLSVQKEEAISYLKKLEDKSLDGIFIDQVVEHLEPDYLINLLQLCFQKLKYGYYIFVETVNPLSFVSFANFYIDMTHKKPIHPETLKFLLTSAGFRDLDTKFFSPVSEEVRLKKVPMNDDTEERTKKQLEVYNHNIEQLNNILYGAQDYAVIGKK